MTDTKRWMGSMMTLLLVVSGCARNGDEPKMDDPAAAALSGMPATVPAAGAPATGVEVAEPVTPAERAPINVVAVPAGPRHPGQFLAVPAAGESPACGTCSCQDAACICRPLSGDRCVCTDLESRDCDCTCPAETITPLELVTGGPAMAASEELSFVPTQAGTSDPGARP
jgi:hypothetical protein